MTVDQPEQTPAPEDRRALLARLLSERAGQGEAVHPLSHNQRAMWFLHQLAPEKTAYNVAVSLGIDTDVDEPALREAVQHIVDRHEILRSHFTSSAGEPVAVVRPTREPDFGIVDVGSDDRQALRNHLQAEVDRPFDLEAAPPARFRLFRTGETSSVLHIVMHHIVTDGWSFWILLDELNQAYEAARSGTAPALPEVAHQYSDFVRWQRDLVASDAGREMREHWVDTLRSPTPLDVPTDRPRGAENPFAGSSVPAVLPQRLVEELRKAGRAKGTTFFAVVAGAFGALLSRYSGEHDISLASPMLGRSRPEFVGTVGDFVNTVVLRFDLSENPTAGDVVERARIAVNDALANQDYPFALVVEEVAPQRDPARNPIAQASINLMQPPGLDRSDGADAGGLRIAAVDVDVSQQDGQFDLNLELIDGGGDIDVELKYRTDLFDDATAAQMLAHLQELLEAFATDADRPIGDMVLTDRPAEAAARAAANATETTLPPVASVLELIAAHTAQIPLAPAASDESERLSYVELDERAARLATLLRAEGVEPGDMVGIHLHRGAGMLVAMLGVWRAGAAYVALDPTFPQDRRSFIASDAGLAVVVTDTPAECAAPDGIVEIVLAEALDRLASFEPAALPALAPADVAYVMYTSGSTGQPKGVAVSHRNVTNLLTSMADEPGLTSADTLLAVTTISFDISVLELFLPLTVGARVVIAAESTVRDGSSLARVLADNEITVLQATPSTLSMLVASGWEGTPTLRMLLSGGEPLPRDLADRLLATGAALWNMYGPTETTVWSSISPVEANTERISLGRPIANTRFHVVDERGRPVPVGVRGELAIAGHGVTLGYRNRPELTTTRFVADPDEPGRTMYRTGDIVVQRRDGTVDYVGRADHQVKIRGHRVEIGEIEHTLSSYEGVGPSVIDVRGDGADRQLVAFYEPVSGHPVDDGDLRAHLGRVLPPVMIPAAFVALDRLPQTPNRKVDRNALASIEVALVAGGAAPADETERLVADIWNSVLQVDHVGRNISFFELGGHSLLATQVVSRIEAATGTEIALADFFAGPTVAALAELVSSDRGSVSSLPPIELLPRGTAYPLSFAQERMWFLHELAPDNAAYHVTSAFELVGPFDRELFEEALIHMIERHESLRTIIRSDDDGPVQEILEPFPVHPRVIDISGTAPDERSARIAAAIEAETRGNFDFGRPPWRVAIIEVGPEHHVLVTVMHHVIFDQWSAGLLFTEMAETYLARRDDRPVALDPTDRQYVDFSVWQRAWLRADAPNPSRDYWREQLSDLPPLSLPTDHLRPAVQSFEGGSASCELDDRLVKAIRAVCEQNRVSPFMFMLAVFSMTLQRHTGQGDLPVGVPVANRHHLDMEGVIGTFVNTVVLRCRLEDDPSFVQYLGQVRDLTLDAFAHQDVPFEWLVSDLVVDRDLSRSPLFQVMFNMVNAPFGRQRREDAGVEIAPWPIDRRSAQFDLTASVTLDDYEIAPPRVQLEYATALFDPATIDRLLRHYIQLLDEVATDPTLPISQYPLGSPDDPDDRSTAAGARRRDPSEDRLEDLVATRSARSPDKVAVIAPEGEITFVELDRRADQLALLLHELGAGPGSIVGLQLRRGLDMVVALLGVLKAGAAYLPLDPAFPPDRLAFMLDDSGADILLTHSSFRGHLAEHVTHTVELDQPPLPAALDPSVVSTLTRSADDLAYVLYTSGSTGRPKGVAIEHRSVVNFLASMEHEPGLAADDVLVAVTTMSFDISVLEIFLPLVVGATLVIADSETTVDGEALAELMERVGATTLQATPATWSMLIDAGWDGSPALRRALCGGEPLARTLADQILARSPELWNMYGPTETTIWSSVEQIPPTDAPITIGRPIANTTFVVVDDHGRAVPIGVPGELLIGGDGLARGYLHRPELTTERFVVDDTGHRRYRTGDAARMLADGRFEHLGRLDSQVKVRGFRIELGEIEHVMTTHEAAREVVVTAHDVRGTTHLIAHYLADTDISISEWRDHLRGRLPQYMVPSAFTRLDEFPLTPNRKVDRSALNAPDSLVAPDLPYRAPSNATEERIAEIWAEALDLDRVGVDDDFFAIGGHSLLAIRIFARIRRELGVRLDIAVLFEHSTVAAIAQQLERSGDGGRAAPLEAAPGFRHLVQIHDGEAGVDPFFCVHGAGGQVLFMKRWGSAFGQIPLVGIQAVGFDGLHHTPESIEAMAAVYAEEVQRHRPTGPLYIGGYSGGGNIALEMAQQLRREGRDVALLVLIDTFHPSVQPRRLTMWDKVKGWFTNPIEHLLKQYRIRVRWRLINRRNPNADAGAVVPLDEREFYMFDHLDEIRNHYSPATYDGTTLLLRTEEVWPMFDHVGPRHGWVDELPLLVVREVPGDHNTVIEEPHVGLMLDELVGGLVEAQRHGLPTPTD